MLIIIFLLASLFKDSLERERLDQSHVQSKLEKLDMLEKEYTRLTTMQSIAEVCCVCCKQINLAYRMQHFVAV